MIKKGQKQLSFLQFLLQTEQINIDQFMKLHELETDESSLYKTLCEQKILSKKFLDYLIAQYEKIPEIDLYALQIQDTQKTQLPEYLARKTHSVMLAQTDGSYQIGMKNPLDIQAINLIAQAIHMPFTPHMIDQKALQQLQNIQYCNFDAIKKLADDAYFYLKRDNDSNKIITLVQGIIRQAYLRNASDIHFEESKSLLRIRMRLDGQLLEHELSHPEITGYIFRIIKSLAGLDIAESHNPQEGSFNVLVDDQIVNIRLSILPIDKGQSAVLRLLKNDETIGSLSATIGQQDVIDKLHHFIAAREGMLLITGPTGSGKSTSLYSILKTMNTEHNKIITLEDPIEVRVSRVNQIQINPEKKMDFADALRYALRQDPDIIMVGEIRDKITAQIATRSAITGHKLLSTLHTKDVIATVDRLLDLEVDPFMLSSALQLVLAQRLVRSICHYCKEDHLISNNEKLLCQQLNIDFLSFSDRLKIGKGCGFCHDTGTLGRQPVFESLVITDELTTFLATGQRNEFKFAARAQIEGKRLLDNALVLAKNGDITLSEALSLTMEIQL